VYTRNQLQHCGLKKGDCCCADRKELKVARWVQIKEMEEKGTAVEDRRATAEEQRAAIEERRVAVEEVTKRVGQEQRIMFMDPSSPG
jgi:hypothetical protein